MSDTQSMTTPTTTDRQQADTSIKKQYAAPRLLVHGTVAALTAINGSGTADKVSGSVIDA